MAQGGKNHVWNCRLYRKTAGGPIILDGLSKLEYRGYDSAGIAVFDGQKIHMEKAVGRLRVLDEKK